MWAGRVMSMLAAIGSAVVIGPPESVVAAPAGRSTQTATATAPWWTHAAIYEIYPRSFQDSDGDGVGDLNGITQRLDYLQRLGVDAIWITPFFPSPNRDFGYDVSDYAAVAPEYGTMADWDRLTAEARRRGIRVLVDFVVNHTSDQHPWFKQARSSRTDAKRDWYVWRDPGAGGGPPTNWRSIFGGPSWTLDPTTGQYYYQVFLPQQPDVNWRNPQLRRAMMDVVRFWLAHGASGFRLDATPYLLEDAAYPNDPAPASGAPVGLKPYNSGLEGNHDILREMRSIVDAAPGQAVLLGESTTADIAGLAAVYGARGDEINLPMDFLYGNLTKLDGPTFKRVIDEAELKLGGRPPVFFFSSHDHSRQWSAFGDSVHDEAIAKLTAAMTLTLRGTALIYYGEEIGMSDMPRARLDIAPLGPKRPVRDERDRARTPMQWSAAAQAGFTSGVPWLPVAADADTRNVDRQRNDPASMYAWYRDLLRLRHDDRAIHDGAYLPLSSGSAAVVAYARDLGGDGGVLVVLNMSAEPQAVSIGGWPGAQPAFGRPVMTSATTSPITAGKGTIAPYGVLIQRYGRPIVR